MINVKIQDVKIGTPTDVNVNMGQPIVVENNWTIGDGLKLKNGILSVDTAEKVEEDNTRPITSAAVYTEIGNIEALLAIL